MAPRSIPVVTINPTAVLKLAYAPSIAERTAWIREMIADRPADAPLVPLTRAQVRKRWGWLREAMRAPRRMHQGPPRHLRDLLPHRRETRVDYRGSSVTLRWR